MEKVNITKIFACNVFNDTVMRERLPKEIYKAVKQATDEGLKLKRSTAQVVANAMKDWAIEKGATHYTHWFQPMTGITAEKHDAFISPSIEGKVFMEFSGKELVKGEPDASSFPSGGLRATFEARGYTAWDPTSYAFIKDCTLYIPTAFCSYSGEALDKKTPLLRSMETINNEALRLIKLFGIDANRVIPTVGVEQEYFLIDKDLYNKRKDLMYTGRTLFGADPPKGQEMNDHYFGNLKDRISEYMKELDIELWKLGVYAKTKHNEAAPAQHELACIFTSCNLASDHNQLVMELMKKIASKHNLVCLLHEKPFLGVNGSGKHNNWSLATDKGQNLLEPGLTPENNKIFLLIVSAILKAVKEYADLLRITIASAGNDHRLGGHEAPPAIVSVFLGDELTRIYEAIEKGENVSHYDKIKVATGVSTIPNFSQDTTDRNRTSPFAFTGNKFEFRMVGSNTSVSGINVILNTAIAQTIGEFADILEKAKDFDKEVDKLIKKTIVENKQIIFNGNNYSKEWVIEAEKRGLPNYKSSVDAIPHFSDEKNIKLFTKHKIFTEVEVNARRDIFLESYSKTINIEASTISKMTRKDILPAAMAYSKEVCDIITAKSNIDKSLVSDMEKNHLAHISSLVDELFKEANILDENRKKLNLIQTPYEYALFCQNTIISDMERLRKIIDTLEGIVSRKYWPYPTSGDLLFSI